MENRPLDDQLQHPALRLIAARPDIFLRQGHVAATWRRRNGKTFGPYFRLSYRGSGRQNSIYLGRAGALVERVRQALATLQQPLEHVLKLRRSRKVATAPVFWDQPKAGAVAWKLRDIMPVT